MVCVDEKPSIQALQRKTGYVFTSSGKLVRGLKSTYKRHGTINLFAALNIATGTIQSKTTATKKRPDFQAFLDEMAERFGRRFKRRNRTRNRATPAGAAQIIGNLGSVPGVTN